MIVDIYFNTIRGNERGKKLIVNQMCNDWVTATYEDGNYANDGQPISLRNTYFSRANRPAVLQLERDGQLGQMFKMYYSLLEFMDTGRFRKKVV